MHALVFSFTRWQHHAATDLELIQRHLDAGDRVSVLACVAEVPACHVNLDHERFECAMCITTRFEGFEMLRDPDDLLTIYSMGDVLPAPVERRIVETPVAFRDTDAGAGTNLDEWDVGLAALSTAISVHRDDQLADPRAQVHWERLTEAGRRVFAATDAFLDQHTDVSIIHVFNGRDAMARGTLRAGQKRGVEVKVHERASDHAHFATYDNAMPHDRAAFTVAVRSAWVDAKAGVAAGRGADPAEVGERFFTSLREGQDQRWFSFVRDQQLGQLPERWNPDHRNIVVFNSSEDEFAAIGPEWKNPFYETQADGVARLWDSLRSRPKDPSGAPVSLWVRMHPNLKDVDNESTRRFDALVGSGVHVIPPASPVSTYSLIDAADAVVSFGSTVGVEATVWGTPSVLLGPAMYEELGAVHRPTDHDSAVEMLACTDRVGDRIGALQYGHYLATDGEAFRHYEPVDLFDGSFNGQQVRQLITPYALLAPALAGLRITRPRVHRMIHRPLRAVLYAPFAPVARLGVEFRAWLVGQAGARRLYRRALKFPRRRQT